MIKEVVLPSVPPSTALEVEKFLKCSSCQFSSSIKQIRTPFEKTISEIFFSFLRPVNHRCTKDWRNRGKKVFFINCFMLFFVTNIMKKHFHYRFAVAHRKAPIRECTHTPKRKWNFPSSSPTVFIENFPLWEHGRFSSFIFVISDGKWKKKKKTSSLICVKICFVFFSLIVISIDAEARSTL